MSGITENQKSEIGSKTVDHLANERTYLSWVRTSIGVMAFGFVIERFSLFMREFSALMGESKKGLPTHRVAMESYSSIFGEVVVAVGLLICLLAFYKFKRNEKQIEFATYRPSVTLDFMLTAAILLIGAFLLVYLNFSI